MIRWWASHNLLGKASKGIAEPVNLEFNRRWCTLTNRKKPLVIAALPAFNEEATIAKIIIASAEVVDRVVVVDDGSVDDTAIIAKKNGAIVVRHQTNRGIGAARQAIFETARAMGADILVSLDADGQHSPKDIPKLIEPILSAQADVVIGSRYLQSSMKTVPPYRRVGLRFFNKLFNIGLQTKVMDTQSGYLAFSKRAIETLSLTERGMGLGMELYHLAEQNGLKVKEVPIKIEYDGVDGSTYGPIRHGFSLIESFFKYMIKKRPILFLGLPGISLLFSGIGLGLFSVSVYLPTNQLFTGTLVLSILTTAVGLLLVLAALVLSSISKTVEKMAAAKVKRQKDNL